MTPAKMQVKHDPANGVFGDCARTCIAVLLDRPPIDVPHFFHDGCDGDVAFARIREFLAPMMLYPSFVAFKATDFNEAVYGFSIWNADMPFIMCGHSPNGPHWVVCKNGEIVCDPSWTNNGLTGPYEDGTFGFVQLAYIGR